MGTFDANKDGKVSIKETMDRFGRMDKNKDGFLDGSDMTGGPGGGGPGAGGPGGGGPGAGGPGAGGPGAGGPGGGGSAPPDLNKDGRISVKEFNDFMDRLDIDKDGFIDGDEASIGHGGRK
jgi:Ca2+-binding EF-hand superfamily protein